MSTWDTADMASALPPANADAAPAVPGADFKNPQEHGWVAKTNYDYETYNKSTKELAEVQTSAAEGSGAVGGLGRAEWACNAAVYEWNDEYGDVGPEYPELEEQLFRSENRVRTGIKFEK